MNFIKGVAFQKKRKQFLAFILAMVLIVSLGLVNFSIIRAKGENIAKAVNYIKSKKQDSWTTMALAAAGESNISLDHLKSISDNSSASEYSKSILALAALGKNPTKFGNEDYVEELKNFYKGDKKSGQFDNAQALNDDIWAILALGSLGKDYSYRVQNAKKFILENQNQDGGWGWVVSGSSDTNSTAAAIMALLEAGVSSTSPEITQAISYLKSNQNKDGGFPFSLGTDSDSCSDAWVISAIYKLGQDPKQWVKNGKNPKEHLKSLQNSDGGFLWKSSDTDSSLMCTCYAVIALTGKFYPVNSSYNQHHLIIEGKKTICDSNVYGATPMELIINGSEICNYSYWISNQWEDKYGSLFLEKINGKEKWLGYVNNTLLSVGFDSYYLKQKDEVLIRNIEKEKQDNKNKEAKQSQKVKLKVEIEKKEPPRFISFSIEPAEIDFGKMELGELSTRNLNINNKGDKIDLEAEVSGSLVFQDNLKVDKKFWQDFSTEVEKSQNKKIPVELAIPQTYIDSGTKEGELIFWATISE